MLDASFGYCTYTTALFPYFAIPSTIIVSPRESIKLATSLSIWIYMHCPQTHDVLNKLNSIDVHIRSKRFPCSKSRQFHWSRSERRWCRQGTPYLCTPYHPGWLRLWNNSFCSLSPTSAASHSVPPGLFDWSAIPRLEQAPTNLFTSRNLSYFFFLATTNTLTHHWWPYTFHKMKYDIIYTTNKRRSRSLWSFIRLVLHRWCLVPFRKDSTENWNYILQVMGHNVSGMREKNFMSVFHWTLSGHITDLPVQQFPLGNQDSNADEIRSFSFIPSVVAGAITGFLIIWAWISYIPGVYPYPWSCRG